MKKVCNDMKLWYKSPANEWNEALPIGNGRLGAMIFGGVKKEYLQLNEDSVWSAGPIDRNNPDALAKLPEIRKLVMEGKINEAERLASLALSGIPECQRYYQPLGNFYFDTGHGDVDSYVRELDISSGISRVKYSVNNINYSREYFSSTVDQSIIIRLTSDVPKSISLVAVLKSASKTYGAEIVDANTLMLKGCGNGEDSIKFYLAVKAVLTGGSINTVGENLVIENADSVTLILSAATSFRHKDYKEVCFEYIKNALGYTYKELFIRHAEDYKALFDRMSINLQGEAEETDLDKLPTNERLQRVREGYDDAALVSLYFQFGRYLLISSSRPGTLPANLQGIWNKDMMPAWDSKYTININTEMNYWPAEICNLAECHLPLFDHIERMREHGRKTAKKMYGCRGFVAHHNTDIWGDTAPQDVVRSSTFWPMGAAWLCLHLWEHYEFNCDIEFLKKVYETMKESAEFFVDFLIEDSKGRLVTCPSISPENQYILPNGETGTLCLGPSMDSQIIRSLFTRCIKAAELLKIDKDFCDELEVIISKLPKIEIGKYGQIKEWAEDYDEIDPGHRHISHLFALYPGNIITMKDTPDLANGARNTLVRRLANGGGHTGWSRAWIINMWARLEDGEKVYENVMELLRKSTLDNLLDNHPPFQIDGNFGGTAGITEMLLQSHAKELNILPALPKAWVNGFVKGVRARGGFEIDIKWENMKLDRVTIKPMVTGITKIMYRGKVVELEMIASESVTLDGNLRVMSEE